MKSNCLKCGGCPPTKRTPDIFNNWYEEQENEDIQFAAESQNTKDIARKAWNEGIRRTIKHFNSQKGESRV